jgi:3'-5' exoribonuclease
MMDPISIRELREGDNFNQVFRLASCQLLTTRTGKPYLNVSLGDATGEIEGKIWDNADIIKEQLDGCSYVRVIGSISSYKGKLQVKVDQLKALSDDDIDPAQFLPSSDNDPDQTLAQLKKICMDNISDPHLLKLMELFFGDEELMKKFKISPAAKGLHHTYIHGLMEHTLSVTKICLFLCGHYSGINKDILISAAVLHDIGKTDELTATPNFDYTTQGRLIGHVVIGLRIFESLADQVEGFSDDLRMLISHMLLSHMGQHEYKSPVVPMFTEAMILHAADDLDAKTELTRRQIENDTSKDSDFTAYHRLLERYFYKGVTAPKSE